MTALAIMTTLDTQVQDAIVYHELATKNIELFVETVTAIYDGQEWQRYGMNWTDYCKEYLPCGASNIRHMKKKLIITDLIERVSGVTPLAKQVQWLGDTIKQSERHYIPRVYQLAYEVFGDDMKKRHIASAFDMVKELAITGAVSVDGESVPAIDMNQMSAFKEKALEADKRLSDHRSGANKREVVSVSFEMLDVGGSLRLVASEEVSYRDASKLAIGIHKVYIDKDTDDE